MRSISIVYKRPKRKQQSQEHDQSQVRRYVDEYFSKIRDKNKQSSTLSTRMRSKTAQVPKKPIQNQLIGGVLNIATMRTPSPFPMQPQKTLSEKILIKNKKNFQKRIKPQFLTVRFPKEAKSHEQQLLFTKHLSKKKQLINNGRVKVLSKINCPKRNTVIVSADFVINQFSFWKQQAIDANCMKVWKKLIPLVNVVWLVRQQATADKIIQLAQNFNFQIDGILKVQPSKKQSLMISYHNFQKQAKLKQNQNLLIIHSLCVSGLIQQNFGNICQYQLRNTLPLVLHRSTYVHFVKTNKNDKNRFSQVLKVISSEYPKPMNVNHLIQKNRQIKIRQLRPIQLDDQEYEDETVQRLTQFKKKLTVYCDRSFGLNKKIDGDSLHYIIGDTIKRNMNIARQYYKYCWEAQHHKIRKNQTTKLSPENKSIFRTKFINTKLNIANTQYNRLVYVWTK